MEFYNRLETTFGYTPFYSDNINFKEYSLANIRKMLSRLVENKKIYKYDTGIYYIPKQGALNLITPSFDDIIYYKYIYNNNNYIGFYTGLTFLYNIGITTQVPFIKEIITNKEKSKKRNISINNKEIILRNTNIKINNDNYLILQFMYCIKLIKQYGIEDNYNILKKHIIKNKFTKLDFYKYTKYISSINIKIIIESGLINEFA